MYIAIGKIPVSVAKSSVTEKEQKCSLVNSDLVRRTVFDLELSDYRSWGGGIQMYTLHWIRRNTYIGSGWEGTQTCIRWIRGGKEYTLMYKLCPMFHGRCMTYLDHLTKSILRLHMQLFIFQSPCHPQLSWIHFTLPLFLFWN